MEDTLTDAQVSNPARQPVFRVSRGRFPSSQYEEVKRLLEASSVTLVPAIRTLPGLLFFHASVDAHTGTMVNVSVWETLADARQLDTLKAMLDQRPVLEGAGLTFEPIVNYEPLWTIDGVWSFPPQGSADG